MFRQGKAHSKADLMTQRSNDTGSNGDDPREVSDGPFAHVYTTFELASVFCDSLKRQKICLSPTCEANTVKDGVGTTLAVTTINSGMKSRGAC